MQLGFQQVRLTSLEICPNNTDGNNKNQLSCTEQKNILQTFMTQTDVDMSWGLDFFPRGAILARITHLAHNPFNYRLTVFSESRSQIRVTVRIFLGPAKNFAGNDMPLADQKHLMIEMDRFTAYCMYNLFMTSCLFILLLSFFYVRKSVTRIFKKSQCF